MEYIYAAAVSQFIDDVNSKAIIRIIMHEIKKINVSISTKEFRRICWKTLEMKQLFVAGKLDNSIYVVLGIRLPYTKYLLDYMLFGTHSYSSNSMEYVTLRDWKRYEAYNEIEYGNFKTRRGVFPHPSQELYELYNYHKYYYENNTNGYSRYNYGQNHLQVGGVSFFYNNLIDHHQQRECIGVYEKKYFDYTRAFRTYSRVWYSKVIDRIKEKVGDGRGKHIFDTMLSQGHHRTFNNAAEVVDKIYNSYVSNFVILGPQILIRNSVVNSLKNNLSRRIFSYGQSGTGNRILAIRLLKSGILDKNIRTSMLLTNDQSLIAAQRDYILKNPQYPTLIQGDDFTQLQDKIKLIIVEKSYIVDAILADKLAERIQAIENSAEIVVYFDLYGNGQFSPDDVVCIQEPEAIEGDIEEQFPQIGEPYEYDPNEWDDPTREMTPEEEEFAKSISEAEDELGDRGNLDEPKQNDNIYEGDWSYEPIWIPEREEDRNPWKKEERDPRREEIRRRRAREIEEERIRREEERIDRERRIERERRRERETELPSNASKNEADIWSTIFGGEKE